MPNVRMGDNYTMRTSLITIQDIVGENGLKSVLNYAHLEKYIDNFPPDNDEVEIPWDDFSKLLLSLLELFGEKGSHGLKLRVGREFGRRIIEGRAGLTTTLKASTRLLPEKRRLIFMLDGFRKESEKKFPSPISPRTDLKEEEGCLLYIDKDYYGSEGITSEAPFCGAYAGLIQYLVEWITGHSYKVDEIECRAMGHPADVFKITKAENDD